MQRSLKSGVNCNNRFELEFRRDVFRFLFNAKGRKPPLANGRGLFYDLEDSDTNYFSDNSMVCIVYDRLGNGCKIKWSSVFSNSDGTVKPSEIISVTIVKSRC